MFSGKDLCFVNHVVSHRLNMIHKFQGFKVSFIFAIQVSEKFGQCKILINFSLFCSVSEDFTKSLIALLVDLKPVFPAHTNDFHSKAIDRFLHNDNIGFNPFIQFCISYRNQSFYLQCKSND